MWSRTSVSAAHGYVVEACFVLLVLPILYLLGVRGWWLLAGTLTLWFPATIFRIERIVWISPTEVKVSGGYEEGNLSASGNTYTVVKNNEKWTVTKDDMGWISELFYRPTQ